VNVVEKNISPAINIRVLIEDFIKDFVIKKVVIMAALKLPAQKVQRSL
jgi:hypothetical protein